MTITILWTQFTLYYATSGRARTKLDMDEEAEVGMKDDQD
jgi:hypothetical protein